LRLRRRLAPLYSVLFQNKSLWLFFQSKEVRFDANRYFEDIEGAPFKLGDAVRVLNNPNWDCTFDEQ